MTHPTEKGQDAVGFSFPELKNAVLLTNDEERKILVEILLDAIQRVGGTATIDSIRVQAFKDRKDRDDAIKENEELKKIIEQYALPVDELMKNKQS